MNNELTFRIILPLLILAFMAHRGYYTRKHDYSDDKTLKKREEGLVSKISGLLGLIGFIATLVFVINPKWMAWAALTLPFSVHCLGVGVALIGFALLQWAQNTLGKNWSDTPRMMKEQKLTTSGPYQWIRHPIYTAFLLILGSTLFISANWMIGLAFLGMTALEIASRIGFEESLMIEYFGNEYREYMKRTGRILPKLI